MRHVDIWEVGTLLLTFMTDNTELSCRSKAVFNTPADEDIGIYSCIVTHTDGASASYNLDEEGQHMFQKVNVIFVFFFILLTNLFFCC